jgi:hypothetical protein
MRRVLLFIALILLGTGIVELVMLVQSAWSWPKGLWAGVALASGGILFAGAWQSSSETVARWFRRR